LDVDKLLEPCIAAATMAVHEWGGAEMVVREVSQTPLPPGFSDLSAAVTFLSGVEGALAFCCPEATASALARKILTEVTQVVDDALMRDCLGEMANLLAGQLKGLLHGTPYHFTFSTPTVMVGAAQESLTQHGWSCLTIVFDSDQGAFALQMYLKEPLAAPGA
jgi:chemotaxis protein CheX